MSEESKGGIGGGSLLGWLFGILGILAGTGAAGLLFASRVQEVERGSIAPPTAGGSVILAAITVVLYLLARGQRRSWEGEDNHGGLIKMIVATVFIIGIVIVLSSAVPPAHETLVTTEPGLLPALTSTPTFTPIPLATPVDNGFIVTWINPGPNCTPTIIYK
jgi:hypothetical protein